MDLQSELRAFLPSWSAEFADPFGEPHAMQQLWLDDGTFRVEGGEENYRLTFFDQVTVDVNLTRQMLQIGSPGDLPASALRHFLADQVVPRILAHAGALVIHSAAVANRGSAFLFVGPSRSGKSTLAAHFHAHGHSLLGDDAVLVESDGAKVMASVIYRSMRLFSDSIHAVGKGNEGEEIGHFTAKRNLSGDENDRAAQPPLHVRAIILIDPAPAEAIAVRPLSAADACMALVEHSFWLDPTDMRQTRKRMAKAGAIAASVPAWTLSFPRQFDRLPAVREAIAEIVDR